MAIGSQVGDVKLTNVGLLIARCWCEAKEETIRTVGEKYWGPAEEQITFLFASELRVAAQKASNARKVEDEPSQGELDRHWNLDSVTTGRIGKNRVSSRPRDLSVSQTFH